MRFLGGILVLILVVMGFFSIFAATEGAYEMFTIGAATHADAVVNWITIALVFLTGLSCFAAAPMFIVGM